MMNRRPTLAEIEGSVCDLIAEHLAFRREELLPSTRFGEDLRVDSLDIVELLMAIEQAFDVTLDDDPRNPVGKTIFTRAPFRISDLTELVYVQLGSGVPKPKKRSFWSGQASDPPVFRGFQFTQLDGRWDRKADAKLPLFELIDSGKIRSFRRRSDGMRCLKLPASIVEIGCNAADSPADEGPRHLVELDSFLIDVEPVSTTAYCRFLNSIENVRPDELLDWFVLDPKDDRQEHALVVQRGDDWRPVPGTEQWPMILVSWYGANAYSLWANGKDWKNYLDFDAEEHGSFLPSEAQWEYAARGPSYRTFPWGEDSPTSERMQYAQHARATKYRADTLPLVPLNVPLGLSPFSLNHMAGNVWQWCRD
ncbi:MAG: SUMF1/EgtB/PvdO family nonheme iron enzyme, partial [Planctomycetes bacterium]|nr:SUMF1/EgtB/PvdO family nonheme iron enzyme [Planctomycetota bacterium]